MKIDTILGQQHKRKIKFDPELHKYTDEYGKTYTSVTQLIGTIEPQFDTEFWSMYRAIDQTGIYKPRPDPVNRQITVWYNSTWQTFSIDLLYSGILPVVKTPGRIVGEWKETTEEACAWGTVKHNYLEECINRFTKTGGTTFNYVADDKGYTFKVASLEEFDRSPLVITYPAIASLLRKLIQDGYVLYAELRVYDPEALIAGTIDLIAIKQGKFVIVDWKTNRKPLKFEAGYYKKQWDETRTIKYETDIWVSNEARLLYPLMDVPYCKGSIYTLQLSLYAYICERWGLTFEYAKLCHIRPKVGKRKEILYDEVGNRIEEEPEIYSITYNKGAIERLVHFHKQNNQHEQN